MKNFFKNENVHLIFFSVFYLIISVFYAWYFFEFYSDLHTALIFLICNFVFCGFSIGYKIKAPHSTVINLLLLLLVNTFNIVVFTEVLSGGGIRYENAAFLGINIILYAVPSIILLAITNRIKITLLFSNLLFFITGLLNAFFICITGKPFYLHSISELDNLVSLRYIDTADCIKIAITGLGYILVTIFCLFLVDTFKSENFQLHVKSRWLLMVLSIVVIICGITLSGFITVYDFDSHARNGFALNIAAEIDMTFFDKPTGYSTEKADEILAGYESETISKNNPNVIVIVDNKFSDLRTIGNFNTNRAVTPYIDSLYENTLSGQVYVPSFGENSSITEYELLTGNSSNFTANPRSADDITKEDTLIHYFQLMGYRTTLMAPITELDRYDFASFDEKSDLADTDNIRYIRGHVSDESVFHKAIGCFEEKSTDEKLFLYIVTEQNKGFYGDRVEDFNQQIFLTDERGKYPKAEQYLSLMYETDKAVNKLVEYFKGVSEPTVIMFLGASQGNVERAFYEKLYGKPLSTLSREEAQRMYTSRFFIWANFDIPEQNYMKVSVNYLSSMLVQTAGLPLTKYQSYLQKLQTLYPVVSIAGIHDIDGQYYPAFARNSEIYDALIPYHMLVYRQQEEES